MIELTVLDSIAYKQLLNKKPLIISYAFSDSPFGICLIGTVESKICHLSFMENKKGKTLNTLRGEWPGATMLSDPIRGQALVNTVFSENSEDVQLHLLVRGTKFQENVWRTLLKIKKGETLCYGDVAAKCGCPTAVRAVASAVARNRVAYLIPCHRVISKTGNIYKYSGGESIKKKLLEYEGFSKG